MLNLEVRVDILIRLIRFKYLKIKILKNTCIIFFFLFVLFDINHVSLQGKYVKILNGRSP